MTRLAEIQTHVSSMDELLDIVGALRSLSSMRVQEASHALSSVRRYGQTLADAIGAALAIIPESAQGAGHWAHSGRALVVCMSEHGFVGGFNERVIDAVDADRDSSDKLFVLGTRGAALARDRGWTLAWVEPMTTRPVSVPETVRRLLEEIYQRIVRGTVSRVEVIFSGYEPGHTANVQRRRMFPLTLPPHERNPARPPPLHNLPPGVLLEKLTTEYVLALLTEAVTESLASENAARFSAMQSAHENVSQKLHGLRQQAQQARQEEITTELLDLVTGTQAIASR